MNSEASMPAEREEGTTRGSLAPEDATERGHHHLEEDTLAIPEPPPLPSQRSNRHLELVPSPDGSGEERAQWPFEDASGAVPPPRPVRRRTAPRLTRPASHVSSFGRRPKGDATVGGSLKQFPLPPPTEFGEPDVHLRREESVIADAMVVKNDALFRAREYARRASTVAAERGVRFASTIGEHSVAALRKFEAMPRKKQLVFVAAPYALAAVLVLVLLQVRSSEPQAAPANRVTPPAPVEAPVEAPVAAAAAAPAPTPAPEEIPLIAPRPTRAAPTTAPKEEDLGRVNIGASIERTLPRRTRLFSRPAPGKHSARLRKGAAVTIYPDFPAKDGFVLAQSAKGTIGFLSVLHLDGKPDPKIEKKRRNKRRRARRRR